MPGIGGVLRATVDDFCVDEIPAYEPSGQGEHTYARIEKRGLTTPAAVEALARALGVNPRDVGHAGLKDRHATTTQWLSLPRTDPARVLALALPGIRVLAAARHGNKLRTGHLKGNRFTLRVTGLDDLDEALRRTAPIADVLTREGVPNYYGEQRFGRDGDNFARGSAWLRGEPPARGITSSASCAGVVGAVRRALQPAASRSACAAASSRAGSRATSRCATRTAARGRSPKTKAAALSDVRGERHGADVRPEDARRRGRAGGARGGGAGGVGRVDGRPRAGGGARRGGATCGPRAGRGGLREREAPPQPTPPRSTRCSRAFTLPAGAYATVVLREFMKLDPDNGLKPSGAGGIQPAPQAWSDDAR
ncbi:MAG: tRNA pseudouridine(13) synthase TruD [Polyangiales bacterium]